MEDNVIEFGIPFYLSNGAAKVKVKPFFADYHVWEDYINGMYQNQNYSTVEIDMNSAIEMLTNGLLFSETIDAVFLHWEIATKVNLTNANCNKRAWTGAASCSYKFKVPEIVTRLAWGKLSNADQKKANIIAQRKINEWVLIYKNKSNAKNQIRIECF